MKCFCFVLIIVSFLLCCFDGFSAEKDTAEIKAVLDAYLTSVQYPAEFAMNPLIFAPEVVMYWSNGKTYNGSISALKAIKSARKELGQYFVSTTASAEAVDIRQQCVGPAGRSGSCWLAGPNPPAGRPAAQRAN